MKKTSLRHLAKCRNDRLGCGRGMEKGLIWARGIGPFLSHPLWQGGFYEKNRILFLVGVPLLGPSG